MRTFKTENLHNYGHPEVVVQMREEAHLDVSFLHEFFEAEVARGVTFKDGDTVQFFWSNLLIKANERNELELWEPMFQPGRIDWEPGIDRSLRHTILQNSVLGLLGCNPEYANMREAGRVFGDFAGSKTDFAMWREDKEAMDSGWRFADVYPEPGSEGTYRSLFDLSLEQSLIIPFLALPKGAEVIRTRRDIRVRLGQKEIDTSESELLKQFLSAGRLY